MVIFSCALATNKKTFVTKYLPFLPRCAQSRARGVARALDEALATESIAVTE